jgi:uncharacterized protein (TIGR03435 family)
MNMNQNLGPIASWRCLIIGELTMKSEPELPVACVGTACPLSSVQIMMQGLLADRFQLKAHRETRELPVYELVVARNGHRLKEVPAPPDRVTGTPPPPPGVSALPTGEVLHYSSGIAGSAVPLSSVVSALSLLLGRPVVDKTGIKGYYDFKMLFSREGLTSTVSGSPLRLELGPVPGAEPGAGASAPSIFTAVQEYLGLMLDSTRSPVEVLVIDSVQKPKEN